MITAQDLQLLAGKNEGEPYIAQLIDRTKIELGKVFLYGLIAHPITDIHTLKTRQEIIKHLVEHDDLSQLLTLLYDRLAQSENMILSLWAQDGFLNSTQRHYYSLPLKEKYTKLAQWEDRINRSPFALEFKTLWNHHQRAIFLASGIFAAALLPIYAFGKTYDIPLPQRLETMAENLRGSGGRLLALASGLSNHKIWVGTIALTAGMNCAAACKGDYDWFKENFILDNCLQQKMILIADFFNTILDIADSLEMDPAFITNCSAAQKIIAFKNTKDNHAKLKEFIDLCKSSTLQGKPSTLSYQGRVLVAFKLIYDLKADIEELLMAIGELDAYRSCASLFQEFKNKNVSFCFARYKEDNRPSIKMKRFWNPFINADTVVTNSIYLAGPENRNMIITGPNASGKSTLIKAIPINLILAQSIGLAAAEYLEITPFYKIATYLNIVDDIASGNSLFKAQVLRAQEIVNLVEHTPKNLFSFVALDEMFNGTSAKESPAAAYAVIKHLGIYENNISIIATHFPLLTKLEKENSAFANYKVSVIVDDTGIHYPFTIEKGISDQHVALDILRQEGYNGTIVAQAAEILKNISV